MEKKYVKEKNIFDNPLTFRDALALPALPVVVIGFMIAIGSKNIIPFIMGIVASSIFIVESFILPKYRYKEVKNGR